MSHSSHLKPLSSVQIQEVQAIKNSYCEFWNNIKFARGWAEPRFSLHEVEPLLEKASEIVLRIRLQLDGQKPFDLKLRLREGSSHEFLWSVDYNPNEYPEKFIRDIVHATFTDANGYVEGLSVEQVDKYIEEINNYLNQENKLLEDKQKLSTCLKTSIHEVDQTLKQLGLFSSPDYTLSPEKTAVFKKLLCELQDVKQEISELLRLEQEEKKKKEEEERKRIEEEERKRKEKEEEEERKRLEEQKNEEEREKDRKKREEEEKRKKEEEEEKRRIEEEAFQAALGEKKEEDNLSASQVAGLQKMQIVAKEIKKIGTEIKSLREDTDALKLEELVSRPDSLQKVEKLRKKCLEYSNTLMNDLLQLDQIAGGGSTRAERKKQVQTIQSMMDQVDSVSEKLQAVSSQLKEEQERIKAEKGNLSSESEEEIKEEKEKKGKQIPETKVKQEEPPKSSPQTQEQHHQQQPEQQKQKQEEVVDEKHQLQLSQQKALLQSRLNEQLRAKRQALLRDKWQRMKLRVKFELHDEKDKYALVGYIPGMKFEDINISFSRAERAVTIEGVRAPSAEEETLMKTQIRQMAEAEYGVKDIPEEELDMLLVKFTMGRYGKFCETYRVPKNVDIDGIGADYEGGVLQIFLPKISIRPAPVPQVVKGRARGRGYNPYFYGHHVPQNFLFPGHGDRNNNEFLEDRDFWW